MQMRLVVNLTSGDPIEGVWKNCKDEEDALLFLENVLDDFVINQFVSFTTTSNRGIEVPIVVPAISIQYVWVDVN